MSVLEVHALHTSFFTDAVDGLDLACVGEKGGMEILYFK